MSDLCNLFLFRTAAFKVLNLILFIVFVCFTPHASAENGVSLKSVQTYTATLDKIEYNLKRSRYDEGEIPEAIKKITQIKSASTQCITAKSVQIEKFKADLESIGKPSKTEPAAVKHKRGELNKVIVDTEKLLASCQVFILRSDEVLKTLSVEQQKLLSARLFAKSPNIKYLVIENWNKPSLWLKSTQLFLLHSTGIELLSTTDIILLLFIILLSFIVGRFIRNKIVRFISTKIMPDTFSNKFYRSLLAVSGFYAPHLLMSLSAATFCYVMTATVSPVPFISVVAYGLPLYFVFMSVVEIFLNPRKPAVPFHGLPDNVAKSLARRLKLFLLLLFIGYLLFTTLLTQSLPDETLLLSRGILVFVFVLNLIWAMQLLGKIPRFADTMMIRFGVSLVLFIVLIAELLGYRNLSDYVIVAVFGTLFAAGIFILISRLMKELFDGLQKGKRQWQRYIRESLGVKSRKKLPELSWIRFILSFGLWLGLVVVILKIWGLSETGFQKINLILLDGFTVGSLKIIPSRIVFAIITLTVLLALSRWFRAQLERSWLLRTNMDRGAREAVATISGYVGVALALIISLSFSGVEFGNMAIIAGALSVGIGFGLQNIVNNFVSGLILLFERPIKTGDWVVVGNTEGYVKRISIRSTQIQTFDLADVIVPNSDLISGQVTNWMLRDVRGRIRVQIGVAYGSDTLLVQDLLIEVAQKHPLVITDGSVSAPKVLFMAFGDSALLFELRVFIKNIDQRIQVTSDLNFAIDAVFREHEIEVPFPQRDVHIKNDSHNVIPKESE
jgi:small-conductance mechanosensitive channel